MNIASHTNSQYNQDYNNGMRVLLQISHEQGIEVRKFRLVPLFCQMLSEHGVCEAFWKEVRKQNRLYFLECYYSLCAPKHLGMLLSALIMWNKTPQGYNFWNHIYHSLSNNP